jgi:GNAT superfamily N-acetyltransferase
MSDLAYNRNAGEQALAMLEEITDLYDEIHAEGDEQGGIFSHASFIARTTSQARIAGFELVTVTLGDLLVGFGFGHPFPAGRWWGGCRPAPPREILDSSKFAVIELDVRQSYRRQGIGKTLLEILLDERGEAFATLASTPGSIANSMYKRWGWYKVGEFTDSMEALVIPLGAG